METKPGGSIVGERLELLAEALDEYYGLLNQVRTGLKLEEPLVKPEGLLLAEKIETLGLPLLAGGLLDQPHLWLLEYGVILQKRKQWDAIYATQHQQDKEAGGSDALPLWAQGVNVAA